MIKATPRTARAINDRMALDLLVEQGPLTAPQLRELTGLSRPSVSDLIERLHDAALIEPAGESGADRRGPNARLWRVAAARAHVVGVDVRPDHVSAVCADLAGETREEAVLPGRPGIVAAVRAVAAGSAAHRRRRRARPRLPSRPGRRGGTRRPRGDRERGQPGGRRRTPRRSRHRPRRFRPALARRGHGRRAGPRPQAAPGRVRRGGRGRLPPLRGGDLHDLVSTAPGSLDALAERVALGVATIVEVVDPGLVVLGGGIGHAGGSDLSVRVQRAVEAICPVAVEVRASEVADNPVLLGATLLALDAARDETSSASWRARSTG